MWFLTGLGYDWENIVLLHSWARLQLKSGHCCTRISASLGSPSLAHVFQGWSCQQHHWWKSGFKVHPFTSLEHWSFFLLSDPPPLEWGCCFLKPSEGFLKSLSIFWRKFTSGIYTVTQLVTSLIGEGETAQVRCLVGRPLTAPCLQADFRGKTGQWEGHDL